jgi:hypothetical protein
VEADITVADRIRALGRPSDGWMARRIYVIPAFAMPLGDLTRLSRALSEAAATPAEVPREPIHGGTLALEDAIILIRHIVIGEEVRKSDMLASVRVEIDLVSSRLVAIPFEPTKDGLRCSITGVTVRAGE